MTSVQGLNEVVSVCQRKFAFSWEEAKQTSLLLCTALTVEPITEKVHEQALDVARRYRFAWYDSLLLASALQAGCATFWSEGMQDGQRIENKLTIRDPFR